jgi:EamA domain-containing membrane protein RarD
MLAWFDKCSFVVLTERKFEMKSPFSFVAILSSVAIGALIGSLVHPGVPEIAIVWALTVGLYYVFRSRTSESIKAAT